jgi:hypothetical protein
MALVEHGAQDLEDLAGQDLQHAGGDGSAAFVSGVRGGGTQHAERVAIGAIAGRVGGAENGDAALTEGSGKMERAAIHADHGSGAPGSVNQAGEGAVMRNGGLGFGEIGTIGAIEDEGNSQFAMEE